MKRILLLIYVLISVTSYSQNHTISGYVKDKQTGEILIGANIFDKNSKKGTATNSFGFYSLTLKKDSIDLYYTYVGFQPENIIIYLSENTEITSELISSTELEKITVSAEQQKRQNEIGTIKISSETFNAVPSLGGEKDIFKVLQLMPGVQASDEGSSSMIVRGGSPDQNLILLDDVPLYYVNHLGGFLSVFNPYSIKNIKLLKGGFPAQYGGRLSSVIDIRTKDGNLKKTSGEIEIGLISEKISLEGPIIKDKISYIISARKGMLDLYTLALMPLVDINQKIGYNLFDTNIKFNFIISKKSRLSLSFYSGFDNVFLNFHEKNNNYQSQYISRTKWGNTLTSLRWSNQYSEKLFGNITLSASNYKYLSSIESEIISQDSSSSDIKTQKNKDVFYSQITDFTLRTDYDYNLNNFYSIKFGTNAIYHTFDPGVISEKTNSNTENIDTTYSSYNLNTEEIAVYIDNFFKIGNTIFLNAGLRSSFYFVEKKNYKSFEPRFSLNYKVTNRINVKTSFAKTKQYLHLLSNNGTGTPADMWLPATKQIPPQEAWQVTFGFFSVLTKNNIEFSTEAFYKELKNLVEIKEGQSLLWSTEDWQTKTDSEGIGKVYGVEFLLQKTTGKFTGWIAYTLSKNTRQFTNQNLGRVYPYTYDRTHDFSIVGMYKLSKKISFSANWIYMTGKAITFAHGRYYVLDNYSVDGGVLTNVFEDFLIYTKKNDYRMPPLHHLDISVNFEKQKKHGIRTWNLSVYNVYNRKNAYLYYYDGIMEDGERKIVLKKVTLFPIIPSISYSFKF
ncbi:MAG: TonB-dependent receptor [Bacteroidales bacterium]|nr:TonB-dependent receptor [Bacteroidales bacterium]